jgi:hypothetical protein
MCKKAPQATKSNHLGLGCQHLSFIPVFFFLFSISVELEGRTKPSKTKTARGVCKNAPQVTNQPFAILGLDGDKNKKKTVFFYIFGISIELKVSIPQEKKISDPRPKVTKIALLRRGYGHIMN